MEVVHDLGQLVVRKLQKFIYMVLITKEVVEFYRKRPVKLEEPLEGHDWSGAFVPEGKAGGAHGLQMSWTYVVDAAS